MHDFFSYEHFYVLYVKFWELDTDHDFSLNRDDLSRYSDQCLTPAVVDRIMQQVPRKFLSTSISSPDPRPGRMGFEDFIVYMISEEDKTTDVAKEYWFRLLDLDGDGFLTRFDLMYFFDQQKQRMEFFTSESVSFSNVFCQVLDMMNPEEKERISLKDLLRSKLTPFFINIFVNLNKFVRHEQRDVVAVERERAFAHLSEWDRFAMGAYYILSGEDEQRAAAYDSLDDPSFFEHPEAK